MDEKDKKKIYSNYSRDVYEEWNNCDSDQTTRFEQANSKKYSVVQTLGFVKVDANNPLLEPVHGISLKDYTALCLKISSGVDHKLVCQAMGLEGVISDELNRIWPQRLAEDKSVTITTLFGQYYAEKPTLPQLENLEAAITDDSKANLEKLKTNDNFYEELTRARRAAYDYGLDGA
jgi:hypothetical protein